MTSFTGKFTSVRGWALLFALLLGAGVMISACGDEEVPAPTTPAPPPPPPAPTPDPTPEPTGPATPENLRVTASDSTSITWSWNAVEGALGYQGQFSTDATFTDIRQMPIIPAPATSHTVSGLSGNMTGHFRVRSGTGTSLASLTYSDWSDGVSGTTAAPPAPPPATALDPPGNVGTSNRQNNSIAVNWDAVDDAAEYQVQQRANGGSWDPANCGSATGSNTVSGTSTSCVASGLDPATDYDFQVRAVPDSADTTLTVSAWSSTVSERTSGTAPPPPIAGGDDTYEITWVSDANSITWTWSRPTDGRIRFLIALVNPAANERSACPAIGAIDLSATFAESIATWYGGPNGALAQYSQKVTIADGVGAVRRLCVIPTWTDDDAQRYGDVFSAWAATAPLTSAAPGGIALGPKVDTVQRRTTAIDWFVQVDRGFKYETQTISAITGEGLPECGSGSGHDDLTSRRDNDAQGLRLDSGLQTYTTYAACVRATNDQGASSWTKLTDPGDSATTTGEYSTRPAAPPTANYVGVRTSEPGQAIAAADVRWRFNLGTRLPEAYSGYDVTLLQWQKTTTTDGTTTLDSAVVP
ncbi:MAG: fibronectin type III domain-containing protein, partial [Rhodospirillales bacterium]|nr:fibronectin type III domain-containing protein [Rhodospirillales bacterium]